MRTRTTLALLALLVSSACHKAPEAEKGSDVPESETKGDGSPEKRLANIDEADAGRVFTVPFVDEEHDPLVRTRGFLREVLADNAQYARRRGDDFFKGMAQDERPRATVVTCSDARVQSTALDATPENDVYLVRNVGNQLATSRGSVDYGVHHLKTPVLIVLGHTGCTAVKAAMGDYADESDAVRHELDSLHVPKPKEGAHADEAGPWLSAVEANVDAQVAAALEEYGADVAAGKLTVVGAIFDLRNDLKAGFGKVSIVNVNGTTDASKLSAFKKSVTSGGPSFAAASSDAGAREDDKDEIGTEREKTLTDIRDAIAAKGLAKR